MALHINVDPIAKKEGRYMRATNGPGSSSSLVVSNKKAPSLGPYEWITKETLVYRHSYLNSMYSIFDDVTNSDAGFD
jgi:hypothetical protein